jgi:FkbH-like protein
MRYFIFRNTTIERFFQSLDAVFSGYEDISTVKQADRYVWFYLPPVAGNAVIVEKIHYYIDLMRLTVEKIPQDKLVIVCNMKNIFNVQSIVSDRTITDAVDKYNTALYDLASRRDNVKIIDFARFLDDYKIDEWIDWRYYFISQMGLNPRFSASFEEWFATQIRAIEMNRKKCLVLDLDNTLWGGVLGEDGISGIALGGDYPGKVFLLFQQQILELSRQGVILAACSKNNIEDVRQVWTEHPDMLLKEEHFAALRINWNNKADNIREIAQELNIGLDSCVFFDDSPSERELVKRFLPEVVVPDFPAQPYMLPVFFKKTVEQYFTVYTLTDEDKAKTEQYKANEQRSKAQRSFTNVEEYLHWLEIELTIADVNDLTLARAAQMTQKTNQFNLTTRRYTVADLRCKLDVGSRIFTLSVRDRFGDSGITGLCIIDFTGETADLNSLLLSCRILGKQIEEAFLSFILNILKQQGVKTVQAQYIPTAKNMQVKDFYAKNGFIATAQDENGCTSYDIDISLQIFTIKPYFKIHADELNSNF